MIDAIRKATPTRALRLALYAMLVTLLVSAGRANAYVTMAPRGSTQVRGVDVSIAAGFHVGSASIFAWSNVPAYQPVPIRRCCFDEGGYQCYDNSGEEIVVPFAHENLYAMKFCTSTTGSMYFENVGSCPVLYCPSDSYLVDANCSTARWYPCRHFHRHYPVYLGIAPSWSAYVDMGWYPDMSYYGGYYCDEAWTPDVVVEPMAGLFFTIGSTPCYGWSSYTSYYHRHYAPYHTGYFDPAVYRTANNEFPVQRQFRGSGHPTWTARSAVAQHRFAAGVAIGAAALAAHHMAMAHHARTVAQNAHLARLAAHNANVSRRMAAHNANVARRMTAHNARMAAHNANVARRMAAHNAWMAAHNANVARRTAMAHRTNLARTAAAHRANALRRTAMAHNANVARRIAAHNANQARRIASAHRAAASHRIAQAHRATAARRVAAAHRSTAARRVATVHRAAPRRTAMAHRATYARRTAYAPRAYAHRTNYAPRRMAYSAPRQSFGGGGPRYFHYGGGRAFGGGQRSFQSFAPHSYGGGRPSFGGGRPSFGGGGGRPSFGGGRPGGGGGGDHRRR